jgi:hypothetical protein
MKPKSPFAWIDGELYLIATFTLEGPAPSLPNFLKALLRQHDPATILILRHLAPDEATEVASALDDAAVDVWARIVGAEERR